MKAMIFAAGLGTRLRPLTDELPKAMVDINGVPMLRLVIEKLKAAGLTNMMVNVHHFPDIIIKYLGDNDNFGADIIISDERERLLDTGGGLVKAASRYGASEDILVHNADILTDFSIEEMIEHHKSSGNDVTLLVAERHTSRYFLFDENRFMAGWCNVSSGEVKPAGLDINSFSRLAFGGVHILSPRALDRLMDYQAGKDVFSITPFYICNCCNLKIGAYMPSESYSWFDVGKPETLNAARVYMKGNSSLF